jgi:hypothetical protein
MTQNHNANPTIPDALEQALWQLLSSGARYKEYDLMRILVEQGFEQFTPSLEPLELFRAHFLLFHLLYRLQDKWIQEEKGTLAIHSLEIRLLSMDNASNNDLANLADFDETPEEVKDYYLDYEKFVETQEKEVIELLDSFWQSFGKLPSMPSTHISIEESISILQINDDLSAETINRQFRKLSQIHHPDKGGEPEAFRKLCEARDRLKREV